MRQNRTNLLIAVLIISLFLSIGYILFDKLKEKRDNERMYYFKMGAEYGYKQAIIEISQKSSECNLVPLIVENKTTNIIDIACFKRNSLANSSATSNSSD